ncbi:MAG: PAS domain-containing protein [Halioglobus sp.]|nr:PAS domain-containing protein [Halioglobus sp.]
MSRLDNMVINTLEHIKDSVMILGLDGDILHANPAGLRLVNGVQGAQAGPQAFVRLFDRHETAIVQRATATAQVGGSVQFIASSRSAPGTKNWWDVSVSPVKSADGHVSQILAIARDITAQIRKEEFRALEHSMLDNITSGQSLESVLESLVLLIEQYSEDTLCCVLLLDDEGKAVVNALAPHFSNGYAKAVHGLAVGPRAGSCGTAMYRKARVIVQDIFSDPLWEGFDDIKNLSGGRSCWSTPVFSGDGKVVGSFAIYAREARRPTREELILMDSAAQFSHLAIEKHRAQQALRLSEARNRAMLSAMPDWVFLTTREGDCLESHVRDAARFPFVQRENPAMRITELFPQSLRPDVMAALERVSRADSQEDLAGSIKYRGEEYFVQISIVSCEGDKLLVVMRDVSQQTRAESEAAVRRSELAHLGRVALLGEITGTLAHELSQPLSIVRTNADVAARVLASNDVPLDVLRETVDDIVTSSRRAGVIIEQLRALLRKEAPRFQPLDLNEVVRQVVSLTRTEAASRKVRVQVQTNCPEAFMLGDRVQLQQVILNLMLNACDAMACKPEDMRRMLITTEADGETIELSVRDTGPGIPESELEDVFKPFVSNSEKKHGLGLGLAITRSIVSAHKGRIHARNAEGGGAIFCCYFTPCDAAGQTSAPTP